MKLIIRADDYGYTNIHNAGTIEAIKNGIVTTVDLMLDTPGTLDAIDKIKDFPWLSVGWHGGHFWGKPVAETSLIPSMLDSEGNFKFRIDKKRRHEVKYEEALIECRAQVERCIAYLGKAPDYTNINGDDPVDRARQQVCDEYGIVYNFVTKTDRVTKITAHPDEKYTHLHIYMPTQHFSVYKILYHDEAQEREKYDPVQYFIKDEDQLLQQEIVITAWHPGYLDDYVYFDSSKHFNLARLIDIRALCSTKLKDWIVDQNVELINVRDALYSTNEYQNHLKLINSPLYINK